MTKSIDSLQAGEKEYTGKIAFGQTTPSFDLETGPEGDYPTDHLTLEFIQQAAKKLTGNQMQRPPGYSAKQIDGQRAYKAARRGELLEIPAVSVRVDDFEILSFDGHEAHFRIACSKGTYIRSLANDLGNIAGSGAHLSSLRRTKSLPFEITHAWSVEALLERLQSLSN